jgi:hypothetical protein
VGVLAIAGIAGYKGVGIVKKLVLITDLHVAVVEATGGIVEVRVD